MAINYELINKGGISLGTNFELLGEKPLDARLVVPSLTGLEHLIAEKAAYAGMIVYVTSEAKHYQVNADGSYRQFGTTEEELKTLIANETTAAMEFKGAATALPENPAKGDMYKVTATFTVDEEEVKVGDSIVYNGEQWFVIPSGDDIEDTWRPITGVANDSTLTFTAGEKLDVAVANDGTVTYSHETVAAPSLIAENEQTRTYITAVETDGYGHITGYKTATENVEDTNTTYEFECAAEHSNVYFNVKEMNGEEVVATHTVCVDAYSKNETDAELAKKVDVETYNAYIDGKFMSDADLKKHAEDYADSLAGNYDEAGAAAAAETAAKAYADGLAGNYDANGDAAKAQAAAEAKAAELDAALKLELQAEIDADVKVVADDLKSYKESNDAAVAAKVAQSVYDADKATFALKTEVESEVETINNKFNDYVTSAVYAEDKAAIEKSIEDEAKALAEVDAGFETRIANLEANFGDGEGTVEAQIAAAVAAEKAERETAVQGALDLLATANTRIDGHDTKIANLEAASATHALKADVEAEFAKYTKTEDLKTDLGDFTNNAGYAKTADVNAELDKKADKTQVATDIAAAIAPLAKTEDLNKVKETAEAATTVEEVDDQIDAKITALDLGNTYEAIGAETRAKNYVDQKFTDANLDQYTTEQEVKDIVDGVIASAADKDTYNSLTKLVDYIDAHGGEATEMASAIDTLEGKVEVIEAKPAYGITATQISNWDNEVGAKELAASKTTTAEVKTQIEAYGYATTTELGNEKTRAEAKEAELAAAIEAAKTDASNKDVVVLSEAQKYADAAAEGKVNALAGNVYTKEEVYTKSEVEALLTWGSF